MIVNPSAGRGAADRLWSACAREFRHAPVKEILVLTTQDRLHTIATARQAVRERAAAVIAVGGDGTVNDVVTGLMREPGGGDVPLGIVPAGTGNDLASFLSPPPFRPRRIVQSLRSGRSRRIDVGRVNDRFFVNNFGWGIEAQVTRRAAKLSASLGNVRYPLALICALASYHAANAQISIDGVDQRLSLCSLSIANGPATGGGFRLCPHARPDDGILNIWAARALPPGALGLALMHALRGVVATQRYFWSACGNQIDLRADPPLPAHIDGNYLGRIAHVAIELLPNSLRLLH